MTKLVRPGSFQLKIIGFLLEKDVEKDAGFRVEGVGFGDYRVFTGSFQLKIIGVLLSLSARALAAQSSREKSIVKTDQAVAPDTATARKIRMAAFYHKGTVETWRYLASSAEMQADPNATRTFELVRSNRPSRGRVQGFLAHSKNANPQ